MLADKLSSDVIFAESLDKADNRLKLISDIDVDMIPEELVNASSFSKSFYDKICSSSYVKSNCAKMIGTLHVSKDDFT